MSNDNFDEGENTWQWVERWRSIDFAADNRIEWESVDDSAEGRDRPELIMNYELSDVDQFEAADYVEERPTNYDFGEATITINAHMGAFIAAMGEAAAAMVNMANIAAEYEQRKAEQDAKWNGAQPPNKWIEADIIWEGCGWRKLFDVMEKQVKQNTPRPLRMYKRRYERRSGEIKRRKHGGRRGEWIR